MKQTAVSCRREYLALKELKPRCWPRMLVCREKTGPRRRCDSLVAWYNGSPAEGRPGNNYPQEHWTGGGGGGGCISSGETYETDTGRVFIKVNTKSGARTMFDGEFASLAAIYETDTVRVPKPIKVIDRPEGGAVLAMEFIDMDVGLSKYEAVLGEQLASLHLHNKEVGEKAAKGERSVTKDDSEVKYVDKFGFHVNTCCGYLEMDNTWQTDWSTFYADKLDKQMRKIDEDYGDREARDLWALVLDKWSSYFRGVDIQPALIHGDLHGRNAAETEAGPVIFDPASFYCHSEFDLGISYLFGGFSSKFFESYHKVIPKAAGFEGRRELYKLFHYLNHWNHFGTEEYRSCSISSLKACLHA